MKQRSRNFVLVACVSVALSAPAGATIPVVDVASLQQLVQQMLAWQQQLRGMQSQLAQLQQTRTALTGSRGMDQLLRQSSAERNYLPPDWTAMDALMHGGSGAYDSLARSARELIAANAKITVDELNRMPAWSRAILVAARQSAATQQAFTRLAYEHSSARFAALGSLIDKIGATPDVKAIAELQGRIAAEQAMLANEAVKLQSYGYAADAERASGEAARREAIVHGHGNFATRFQPTPPAP